ncbi:MAG: hypothetical protein AAF226_01195 [Verrucomicrobiota bacterium]
MKQVDIIEPLGSSHPLTDLDGFLEQVKSFPSAYWQEGNGGALLTLQSIGEKVSLTLLTNVQNGIYAQFCRERDNRIIETWLSLGDPERLTETAEGAEEYFVSAGLFLQPDQAALCVEDFAKTGDRSSRIQWISPSEIPPEGNY